MCPVMARILYGLELSCCVRNYDSPYSCSPWVPPVSRTRKSRSTILARARSRPSRWGTRVSIGSINGVFGAGTNLQHSTDISCFTTKNCDYNANANTPIRIESLNSLSSSTFTFAGYLASGYPGYERAAQTVLAQGFVGTSSTAVFTTTLGLNADNTFKKFDLTGLGAVNKILLTPQQSAVIGASGYVRLDNVSLGAPTPGTTVAPEPSTILLLACGLGALAVAGRRRALGR